MSIYEVVHIYSFSQQFGKSLWLSSVLRSMFSHADYSLELICKCSLLVVVGVGTARIVACQVAPELSM